MQKIMLMLENFLRGICKDSRRIADNCHAIFNAFQYNASHTNNSVVANENIFAERGSHTDKNSLAKINSAAKGNICRNYRMTADFNIVADFAKSINQNILRNNRL